MIIGITKTAGAALAIAISSPVSAQPVAVHAASSNNGVPTAEALGCLHQRRFELVLLGARLQGLLAGGPAKMAATNKCLARNNKSRHANRATKDASGHR
jgi:hypothetical protein